MFEDATWRRVHPGNSLAGNACWARHVAELRRCDDIMFEDATWRRVHPGNSLADNACWVRHVAELRGVMILCLRALHGDVSTREIL